MKVYNKELMQYIQHFWKISGVEPKDCLIDSTGRLVFVVELDLVSRALGHSGNTIKKLSFLYKKRIKLIGFSPILEDFVSNIILPLRAKSIKITEDKIFIEGMDSENKSMLIGRNSSNVKSVEEIVKRFFPNISNVRVV